METRGAAPRGAAPPDNVRFVAADLAATQVGDLQLPANATWNWLGVTMYLPREATAATPRAIAAAGAGTTLVVNFPLADDALDEPGRAMRDISSAAVPAADEPITGGVPAR